jgi:hypothetical protein
VCRKQQTNKTIPRNTTTTQPKAAQHSTVQIQYSTHITTDSARQYRAQYKHNTTPYRTIPHHTVQNQPAPTNEAPDHPPNQPTSKEQTRTQPNSETARQIKQTDQTKNTYEQIGRKTSQRKRANNPAKQPKQQSHDLKSEAGLGQN